MTTTDTAADQATIIARIPTWATSVELEPDGYILYTRVVRKAGEPPVNTLPAAEIQQSSHLAVDEEAGTVSYQLVGGLQLWLPDIENSISPEKARRLLADLQELLVVVDEIEAGDTAPRQQVHGSAA